MNLSKIFSLLWLNTIVLATGQKGLQTPLQYTVNNQNIPDQDCLIRIKQLNFVTGVSSLINLMKIIHNEPLSLCEMRQYREMLFLFNNDINKLKDYINALEQHQTQISVSSYFKSSIIIVYLSLIWMVDNEDEFSPLFEFRIIKAHCILLLFAIIADAFFIYFNQKVYYGRVVKHDSSRYNIDGEVDIRRNESYLITMNQILDNGYSSIKLTSNNCFVILYGLYRFLTSKDSHFFAILSLLEIFYLLVLSNLMLFCYLSSLKDNETDSDSPSIFSQISGIGDNIKAYINNDSYLLTQLLFCIFYLLSLIEKCYSTIKYFMLHNVTNRTLN